MNHKCIFCSQQQVSIYTYIHIYLGSPVRGAVWTYRAANDDALQTKPSLPPSHRLSPIRVLKSSSDRPHFWETKASSLSIDIPYLLPPSPSLSIDFTPAWKTPVFFPFSFLPTLASHPCHIRYCVRHATRSKREIIMGLDNDARGWVMAAVSGIGEYLGYLHSFMHGASSSARTS